jgi:hypothetical protein
MRCELLEMSSWDLDWDVNYWGWVLETWIEMWTTGDEFLRLGLRCELLVMSSWDLDWDVNYWWWVLETWIEMWTVDEFHYHPSLTYPKHFVHLENVTEHFCLWNQEHKEWCGGGGGESDGSWSLRWCNWSFLPLKGIRYA